MMTPPVSSPSPSTSTGFPPPSTNSTTATATTTRLSPFPNDTLEGQDENNFLLQNLNSTTARTTATRGSARKLFTFPSGGVAGSVVSRVGDSTATASSGFKDIQQSATTAGRSKESKAPFSPPRSTESPLSSPTAQIKMRGPVTVSNVVDHRHALTPGSSSGNTRTMTESRGEKASELYDRATTEHGWRSRNSTESGVGPAQDAIKAIAAATPPRHIPRYTADIRPSDGSEHTKQVIDQLSNVWSPSANVIPRNPRDTSSATASPKYRVRQHQHLQALPHPASRDSQSVQSQASSAGVPLPPSSADWQWGKRIDPDDHEQALFEQRLCEDVYGVAVRKINQNGKSNLRYVKCYAEDIPEREGLAPSGSSSRSLSSRSRGALSRLRGDRDRSVDRSEPGDYDPRRNLIKKNKMKVLTWGKKKDVKLPLDRFVCVRKGKTNERTRRNTSPSSRILSLITDDPQHPSLDIEAPTKLDREKFARAFARFLDVPLENEDNHSVRSAEVAPSSITDEGQLAANKISQGDRLSAANSEPGLDAAAQRTSTPFKTNRDNKHDRPLPVVTTAPAAESRGLGRAPEVSSPQPKPGSSSLFQMAKEAAELDSNSFDIPDPQITSLPSSTRTPISGVHSAEKEWSKQKSSRSNSSSAHGEDSVVSSLSGAGFDQEIVEELHQALNDLKAELEESRAEAARAVKVAEQAIQSAENSNSKDWNSTVTHKAAEAAALAQKRSAEAMAKQRLAEERLEGERRNTAFWRKQAESAEEDAGALQTRAAAASVQREAMAESLESERRNAALLLNSLKQRFSSSESNQRQTLSHTMERNRLLEMELETCRRQLEEKGARYLEGSVSEGTSGSPRRNLASRPRKVEEKDSSSMQLISVNSVSSGKALESRERPSALNEQNLYKLYAEFSSVRKQFTLMQKATADELRSLPVDAQLWAQQASLAVRTSQDEIQRLRSKLAVESATRRKLLHEVQDLRGAVRVYCRPRLANGVSTLSFASNEVLLLHRDRSTFKQDGAVPSYPLSFEFDGIFGAEMDQQGIYDELEDVCLGVLDGFNICLMAYGQTGTGKTHALLGDVSYVHDPDIGVNVTIKNRGLHLMATDELFSVVAYRRERYQDVVTITIVEVHDERLCDLIAGTDMGESRGRLIVEESRQGAKKGSKSKRTESPRDEVGGPVKLEIKTDHNGATVVSGLVSLEVTSIDEVGRLWTECLSKRAERLAEQGIKIEDYEAASHVIATIKVVSTNISTGIGSTGKIQFVDLAGSDVSPRRPQAVAGAGNDQDWKFNHRSLSTMSEVVNARSQFARSVPYRNSTLTHLLSDSLEADTKVVMLACVSPEIDDLQVTACTLRFAAKMRKIIVGKATKHTLTHA